MNDTNKLGIRIRLIKAAISEVEQAYKADVSRAIGDYRGGGFDISKIADKYAAPLEELQAELLRLKSEKESIEWEKSKDFWDMLKGQIVHPSTK